MKAPTWHAEAWPPERTAHPGLYLAIWHSSRGRIRIKVLTRSHDGYRYRYHQAPGYRLEEYKSFPSYITATMRMKPEDASPRGPQHYSAIVDALRTQETARCQK